MVHTTLIAVTVNMIPMTKTLDVVCEDIVHTSPLLVSLGWFGLELGLGEHVESSKPQISFISA